MLERDRELSSLNESFVKELLKSRTAYNYLTSRGLTKETIEKWRLGFCPFESTSELRGRVTIPIENSRGYLVSIGGRVLPEKISPKWDEKAPKYYNLPYSKATTLFGLHECLNQRGFQEVGSAVVVEDYFGVLVAHQSGFSNVVSVCGAFLTEVHLGLLLRETDIIAVAFDPDEGGEKGWLRAKEVSEKYQYPIYKLALEKDLDEILLVSKDEFRQSLSNLVLTFPGVSREEELRQRLRRLSDGES
jgi:DNA primase